MSSNDRQTGTLVQWDDAKGYGFIAPDGGAARLFVHIQAFAARAQRPVVGERLSFAAGRDAQGKPRALAVRPVKAPPAPAAPRDRGRVLLLVPAFAGFVLTVHLLWGVPNWLWGLYSAMSMATFIVYALDKRAARRGDWRVGENTLHALSLACGWPGALLAQQTLRHKSVKPAFRRVYWLTVAVNIAAFTAVFTPLLKS
ncbi:uncharacterized membrane protein YsdA (DUF1294 family)/cold shock CspA family protein [Pelomonas saccharophila]|uniref:Uncharacterized membrane protein YsdA (DUF1294 family)/cold shock CspA family protein n=1 Tax=Roseateles saccharophilus TaxID=304 RepID=A0ABU1YH10_ROSSA|nr:cold shock and DUF1294 domain-containing protein [Roseateles saccharophilus]MDR7268018.1 uncharacterized membrane protein YsdA (DUF1294 family)/cold shock CspA family protein [Roseateles saccharophilus]